MTQLISCYATETALEIIGNELYHRIDDAREWAESFRETSQVICWDRGRPARNAPQARRLSKILRQSISRFALICGRDARGPSKSLECFWTGPLVVEWAAVMEYSHLCLPSGVPIKPVPG